jgi:hypothetical protein
MMMPKTRSSLGAFVGSSLSNAASARHGALLGGLLALSVCDVTHAADFDARNPKDVAAVVTTNGASGELRLDKNGKPSIAAQAGRIYFTVNFDDCVTARSQCGTMIFTGWWDAKTVTASQINGWNRWTLFCGAYLDADGAPELWYSVAVSTHTARDDVAGDVERWMGCLQDFDQFVAAPDDFLKRNGAAAAPATSHDGASGP